MGSKNTLLLIYRDKERWSVNNITDVTGAMTTGTSAGGSPKMTQHIRNTITIVF